MCMRDHAESPMAFLILNKRIMNLQMNKGPHLPLQLKHCWRAIPSLTCAIQMYAFARFSFLFCDNQSTIQGTIVKYGAPAIQHLVNKIYLQHHYTPSMAEKHSGINEPVPNPTMALSISMVGSGHLHIAITNSFC
jgi:hypothetical protein